MFIPPQPPSDHHYYSCKKRECKKRVWSTKRSQGKL